MSFLDFLPFLKCLGFPETSENEGNQARGIRISKKEGNRAASIPHSILQNRMTTNSSGPRKVKDSLSFQVKEI